MVLIRMVTDSGGDGEDGAIRSGEDSAGGEDGGRLRQGAFLRW